VLLRDGEVIPLTPKAFDVLFVLVEWRVRLQSFCRSLPLTLTGATRNIRRKVENKTAGKLLLKQILRQVEDHGEQVIEGDKLTFQKLASIYEEKKLTAPIYRGDTKISGLRSYKDVRRRLNRLVDYFGPRRLKSITHADIERYKGERLSAQSRLGSEMSVANINRELAIIRAALNFAKRQGWITRNPFEAGETLISTADEVKRERILSFDEEEKLLLACIGPRAHIRPILITALDTAMRRGELLRLKWVDIDLNTGFITVRAQNSKTAKSRTIGITQRSREELTKLYEQAPEDDDVLVFGIEDNFYKAFDAVCRNAGIEGFRFHDCRHTAITRMIQAGMPPMEVMKISGHTQFQTFARYVNTDGQAAKRGALALDQWRSVIGEKADKPIIN
jgi:integrase